MVLLGAFFITRSMSRSVEENIRWAILARQAEQVAGIAAKQGRSNES